MYKVVSISSYESFSSLNHEERREGETLPFVFIGCLMIAAMSFVAYESFFANKSATKEDQITTLALFIIVGALEVAQAAAIKKTEDFTFFVALVSKNIIGQAVELLLYDKIRESDMYETYPWTSAVITAAGLGALKVLGQIGGKVWIEDPEIPLIHRGPSSLTCGVAALATSLYLAEATREGKSFQDPVENVLDLSALLSVLWAASAIQSVSVISASPESFTYFASGRQVVSIFTAFELSERLAKGDGFFDSSTLNLLFRSALMGMTKVSGYMTGKDYAYNRRSIGEGSRYTEFPHDPDEHVPLLKNQKSDIELGT